MKNEQMIDREQQRKQVESYLACYVGHIFNIVLAIVLWVSFMVLSPEKVSWMLVMMGMVGLYIRYQVFPFIDLIFKKEVPTSITAGDNFYDGLFAFVPKVKKDFLYFRWLVTGKDHDLLKNKCNEKS